LTKVLHTVARRDVLIDPYRVRDAVVVGHLGGDSRLEEAGTLELGRTAGAPPVLLTNVYLVEPEMLPAGVVALLGVADIRALRNLPRHGPCPPRQTLGARRASLCLRTPASFL
jgi:hypothetical protein